MATTSTPKGFDADARVGERDQAPVTIGGQSYKRAKLNNTATRVLRTQGRRLNRIGRQLDRVDEHLTEALEATGDDRDEDRIATLEGEVDALQDEQLTVTYEMIRLQLGGDDGPPVEHLQEHLDMRDAEALSQFLNGDEGEPDPTTPNATTSS